MATAFWEEMGRNVNRSNREAGSVLIRCGEASGEASHPIRKCKADGGDRNWIVRRPPLTSKGLECFPRIA
jgi:hypothetical protein